MRITSFGHVLIQKITIPNSLLTGKFNLFAQVTRSKKCAKRLRGSDNLKISQPGEQGIFRHSTGNKLPEQGICEETAELTVYSPFAR
jgi:hypothetical protein